MFALAHIIPTVILYDQIIRNQTWPAATTRAESNAHHQDYRRGDSFTRAVGAEEDSYCETAFIWSACSRRGSLSSHCCCWGCQVKVRTDEDFVFGAALFYCRCSLLCYEVLFSSHCSVADLAERYVKQFCHGLDWEQPALIKQLLSLYLGTTITSTQAQVHFRDSMF